MKSSSLVWLSIMVLVIALVLILLSQVASAQPAEEWSKTYGGSGGEHAYSVRQTSDGGYIIAGSTYSFGAGKDDFYLVKTDSQGIEEWSKTYGGSGDEEAYSVRQTSDGGYIIAGYAESFGGGERDFYLVKTDSQGIEEWSKTHGGSCDERAYFTQQTSDGGYIIAGYTESFGAGEDDFYLVKTDCQGIVKWSRTYGGFSNERAYSAQQTSDGGYIIAGYTESFGAGNCDFYLVKTDSQGKVEWSKTYGESIENWATSVQQTYDGGYIIAGGSANSFENYVDNLYLVKTDPQGAVKWSKVYEETYFKGSSFKGTYLSLSIEGPSVQQTSDGGYIVIGFHKNVASYFMKTDPQGRSIDWGYLKGDAYSIQQTSDEGCIIAGDSIYEADFDFYLVKFAPVKGVQPTPMPTPTTLPTSTPVTDGEPRRPPYVDLYGDKTEVTVGEEIILSLSAVNPITSPGTLIINLTLKIPQGWKITTSGFAYGGAEGLWTGTYEINQGANIRAIEIHTLPNEPCEDTISGHIEYYFAEQPEIKYHPHNRELPVFVRVYPKGEKPCVYLYADKTDVTSGKEYILNIYTFNPPRSAGTLIIDLKIYQDYFDDISITSSGFTHSHWHYLCSVNADLEKDLNKGIVSEKLRSELKTNSPKQWLAYSFTLSDNITITKQKKDKWVIAWENPLQERKEFIAKKEDGKLNIYSLGKEHWKNSYKISQQTNPQEKEVRILFKKSISGDYWTRLPIEVTYYFAEQPEFKYVTGKNFPIIIHPASSSTEKQTPLHQESIPTAGGEQREPYVNLYGHKTGAVIGEEIILHLSAINPITSYGTLIIQLTLDIPSGWSVTTSGFAYGGAGGLWTGTYEINQGPKPREIYVHILPNEPGKDKISGHIDYYFAEHPELKSHLDKELYVVVHPASSPIEDEKWRWLEYPKQLVQVIKEAIISLLS